MWICKLKMKNFQKGDMKMCIVIRCSLPPLHDFKSVKPKSKCSRCGKTIEAVKQDFVDFYLDKTKPGTIEKLDLDFGKEFRNGKDSM